MAGSISEAPQVLQEIRAGEGLNLSAAARQFPAQRGTGSMNPATMFWYATKGAKSPSGKTVKLEAVRVGWRWLTSQSAVTRFVERLTEADPTEAPARTPTQRNRAAERAAKELERMGA